MALSSSLAMIIITFFFCILSAHAVRDLPDQMSVPITKHNNGTDKLATFRKVATLPANGNSVSWTADCFQSNTGKLNIESSAVASVTINAQNAKDTWCHDLYHFYTTEGGYLDFLTIYLSGSHYDLLGVTGVPDTIKKNGVVVYADFTSSVRNEGGCSNIKQVEDTFATI